MTKKELIFKIIVLVLIVILLLYIINDGVIIQVSYAENYDQYKQQQPLTEWDKRYPETPRGTFNFLLDMTLFIGMFACLYISSKYN